MIDKISLRKKMKSLLQEKKDDFPNSSEKICQNIISSEIYKKSNIILAYMSLNDEVNLSTVIKNAIQNKKSVYIPKVISQTSKMDFYQIFSEEQTQKGSFGIQEPNSQNKKFETKNYDDSILILIPGRAFSKKGERLGRGKSYYDNFLSNLDAKKVIFAAVCFDCQILEEIPTEPHDIKMDFIFSESYSEASE